MGELGSAATGQSSPFTDGDTGAPGGKGTGQRLSLGSQTRVGIELPGEELLALSAEALLWRPTAEPMGPRVPVLQAMDGDIAWEAVVAAVLGGVCKQNCGKEKAF